MANPSQQVTAEGLKRRSEGRRQLVGKILSSLAKHGKNGRTRARHHRRRNARLPEEPVFEPREHEVSRKDGAFEIVHQGDRTQPLGESCFRFFSIRPSLIRPGRGNGKRGFDQKQFSLREGSHRSDDFPASLAQSGPTADKKRDIRAELGGEDF